MSVDHLDAGLRRGIWPRNHLQAIEIADSRLEVLHVLRVNGIGNTEILTHGDMGRSRDGDVLRRQGMMVNNTYGE